MTMTLLDVIQSDKETLSNILSDRINQLKACELNREQKRMISYLCEGYSGLINSTNIMIDVINDNNLNIEIISKHEEGDGET